MCNRTKLLSVFFFTVGLTLVLSNFIESTILKIFFGILLAVMGVVILNRG